MRRAIYEDDVIKLLDKGWKSGVYPVASNIHALPSAQPENYATDRYDDLREYFSGCEDNGDCILHDKSEFQKWLERLRWHVLECNKLSMELEKIKAAQPEQKWILCSERLPEEDHWLGGSGKQFSDEVLVNVVNYDDEDIWVDISQTIDGMWALELPRHCEITAWRELPEPYKEKNDG